MTLMIKLCEVGKERHFKERQQQNICFRVLHIFQYRKYHSNHTDFTPFTDDTPISHKNKYIFPKCQSLTDLAYAMFIHSRKKWPKSNLCIFHYQICTVPKCESEQPDWTSYDFYIKVKEKIDDKSREGLVQWQDIKVTDLTDLLIM